MSDSTQKWPVPRPIEDTPIPDFPPHIFPAWFEDYARAIAHQESAPDEFPIAVGWAVVSTILQRSVRVGSPDGHTQAVNVYSAIVAPPSSSKSGSMKPMLAPLEEISRERAEVAKSSVSEARAKVDKIEARMKVLKGVLAKSPDQADQEAELDALRKERDAIDPRSLVVPRTFVDDVTPEQLATLMCDAGGTMGLFSDEGTILAHINGAYSKAPNTSLFLKAYDGGTVKVDRRGREESIENPRLTICVMVQPKKIEGIASQDGLLARFRFFCPNARIGYRERVVRAPIPQRLGTAYREGIHRLAKRWFDAEPEVLTLSDQAHQVLTEWRAENEVQRRPGGKLDGSDGFLEWGGKEGECMRLAATLHALDGLDSRALVSALHVEKAIAVMEVLTEHARKVRDVAPNQTNANKWGRKVLAWLRSPVRESQHASLTSAQLRHYLGCSSNRKNEFDAALEQLEGLGWLRELGAMRADSRRWKVNPHVWNAENGRTR